ncbi:hypothetical protein Ddye_027048 [Dipteronia dyeriana]|uniref:Uncharacterized protein n=1 Tax=Dipteronia dyeriana TaxID=168575 RepID=A0AAD9TNT7_9ROSI|nr:hypothetical protein Ddye_027048 [Dipteronia dyeriana]
MSSDCGFKFDNYDEVAFKSMDEEQKRKNGEIADSGVSNNNLRWTSGGVYNDHHQVKRVVMNTGTASATTGDDNIWRRRRQEKSEMLFHLICWGPN